MNRSPKTVLLMAGSLDGGGSERQTLLLAKHLDREAFRPLLYLRHRQGILLKEVPADVPIVSFDDAPPVPWPRWPGRVGTYHVRYLKHVLQQHSVDVIYDRTFQMTMVAGPAAAGLRIPRVATIVSPPARMLPLLEPRFLSIKRRRLAQAYGQAFRVVAVSHAAADSAQEYYRLPAQKVMTIHNPIDVQQTQARAAADCPQESSLRGGSVLHLVTIGRLSIEKGQRILLQAMHKVAQRNASLRWKLWIVGDGPERHRLQQQCQQAGLADQVTFTGHLENAMPLLRAADALILPSLFEGLPNVVLEAMCLGTSVIATDSGGTPELINDGNLGQLVPAGDANALAATIESFLSTVDRTELHQQTQQAKAIISHRYAMEIVIPKIAEVLTAAMSSPPPANV